MRSKEGPTRLGILMVMVMVMVMVLALAGTFAFSATASAETRTFTPADSGQVFEAPAGVRVIEVEAIGGQGGQAYEHYCHSKESGPEEVIKAEPGEGSRGEASEGDELPQECYGEAPLDNGGVGARVLATLAVSPGEELSVHFGGGGDGSIGPAGSEADYSTNGDGGGGSEL